MITQSKNEKDININAKFILDKDNNVVSIKLYSNIGKKHFPILRIGVLKGSEELQDRQYMNIISLTNQLSVSKRLSTGYIFKYKNICYYIVWFNLINWQVYRSMLFDQMVDKEFSSVTIKAKHSEIEIDTYSNKCSTYLGDLIWVTRPKCRENVLIKNTVFNLISKRGGHIE